MNFFWSVYVDCQGMFAVRLLMHAFSQIVAESGARSPAWQTVHNQSPTDLAALTMQAARDAAWSTIHISKTISTGGGEPNISENRSA